MCENTNSVDTEPSLLNRRGGKRGGGKTMARGIKVEVPTAGLQNKEAILNALNRHCITILSNKYYTLESFLDYTNKLGWVVKLAITNKDRHKTVLYANSIDDLIKDLQEIKKKLEREVKVGEDYGQAEDVEGTTNVQEIC